MSHFKWFICHVVSNHRTSVNSAEFICLGQAEAGRTSWKGLGWTTSPTGLSERQGKSRVWMDRSSAASELPGGSSPNSEHQDSSLGKSEKKIKTIFNFILFFSRMCLCFKTDIQRLYSFNQIIEHFHFVFHFFPLIKIMKEHKQHVR